MSHYFIINYFIQAIASSYGLNFTYKLSSSDKSGILVFFNLRKSKRTLELEAELNWNTIAQASACAFIVEN
ncbi:hypothetical protein MATR_10390 [Marivirga tractuosa]|uniref:Uncharacterized protein n=1 Tax=Marivirga tractuosa (strain ATCC 23168 / DSM 4126 / NBRC 15989 / NCIMB 1408 / VKM B-1430 / H-43) TaxID=643867 RepID=E4TM56_MARTH|nr:hypothetical protein Ftrac_1342 [Marivirga tractuosa DSM 4126]BDD14214.1 hypothetical protein MATR_10390 [Marivirga tractuosa]